jgi:HTH-type transcriptional regulator / antitoxin HipB
MSATIARSPQQVGRLIQRFRHDRGLTQTQLAQLAGQRQEMISKIERGHGGVGLATICEVLAALDLELTVGPRTKSAAADIESLF